MNILLHCCFDHSSSDNLYSFIVESLRRRQIHARFVRSIEKTDLKEWDAIISHNVLEETIRQQKPSWGGYELSRVESLNLLKTENVLTIDWATANSHLDILRLFDKWDSEFIILKRSFTCQGKGVSFLTRDKIETLKWNAKEDIFCREITDAPDARVVKIEAFNGHVTICFSYPRHHFRPYPGIKDSPARLPRQRCDVSQQTLDTICQCSVALTKRGFGYCSFDLMANKEGRLVTMELNSHSVATWWSARFGETQRNYALAIEDLLCRPKNEI